MYKLRIAAQAILTIFVVVALAERFGRVEQVPTGLLVAAAVGAAWLAVQRTTWLPFLGPTVLPPPALAPRTPERADMAVRLRAPKRAVKCVYWGSVMSATDPHQAYGGYLNSGVADVDTSGYVKLVLRRPKPYSIYGGGKKQPPHLHYRWVNARGMLGGVRTFFLCSRQ